MMLHGLRSLQVLQYFMTKYDIVKVILPLSPEIRVPFLLEITKESRTPFPGGRSIKLYVTWIYLKDLLLH